MEDNITFYLAVVASAFTYCYQTLLLTYLHMYIVIVITVFTQWDGEIQVPLEGGNMKLRT